MNDMKIVALALVVIVAAPLFVGVFWPNGTETIETYTVEEGTNITPTIAKADIPVIDVYGGPNNNRWLYNDVGTVIYDPVATGSSQSSLPETTHTGTSEILTQSRQINLAGFQGYRLDLYTPAGNWINVDIPGDGSDPDDMWSFHTISYYPATGTIYGQTMWDMRTLTVTQNTHVGVYATAQSPTILHTLEYTTTGKYVDLGQGFSLDRTGNPLAWDSWASWGNGLVNHSVTFWVKSSGLSSLAFKADGDLLTDPPFLTIDNDGGMITVNGETLGAASAYPFVQIEIGEKTVVSGVMGAESFTDATYSLGSSVSAEGVEPFRMLRMHGQAVYEAKSALAEIGTAKGIEDASIAPYGYYPHYAWQVSLTNAAAYGESITIGSTTYPVTDGSITLEDEEVPVRDMAVLSLLKDGVQKVYVNGTEIHSGAPDPAFAIVLNGGWYIDVYVSDVEQGTQTGYTWTFPNWGLSMNGFCMVGMMTSVLVTIAAGLYGRRSGGHAALVILLGIISAGFYYCMMG